MSDMTLLICDPLYVTVVGNKIETYYKKQRPHQTLGYQIPAAVDAAFHAPK